MAYKRRGNSDNRPRFSYKRLLIRMQKKLWFTFGLFCIFSIILVLRLIYISYSSGDKYEKIVLAQQNYNSTVIPFQRGNIVDRKGTVMATSVDVYNVILDCKVLNATADQADKQKKGSGEAVIDDTVQAITSSIPEISEDAVRKAIKNKPDSEYQVLAKKISYDEMDKLQKQMDKKNSDIAGVWFEKEYERQYPYGSLGASTIGFTASGNYGMNGIENEYNSELNGINGRSYAYVNEDGNVEQTVADAQNGNNVVSTIDVNIQSIAEQAVADFNNQMISARAVEEGKDPSDTNIDGPNEGSLNTSVIVMNPKNGEILAMVDYPGYNLNDPWNLTQYYSEDEIAAMSNDDQMNVLNGLWNSYPINSTYEPGSTFKPFTVASGLETGTVTGDETYYCDGGEDIDGTYIHCIKHDGHGLENIQQVLENSCNDAMMQMVRQIGPENFSKYQHVFGFGELTGIDLPGEARTNTLLYNATQLQNTATNLATNAFGQNFNVTMIQMASAFSSLVNGGYYYQPHVVSQIQDPNGNVVKTIEPVLEKKTVSEETSSMIRGYLKGVVEEGSGRYAQVANYSVGGKTGTAEKTPRGQGNYLVSFIGAAPIEDPQVVIYCVVNEPNTNDQAHSKFPQSICQNILTQILPYLDVPTVDDQAQAAAEAAAEQAKENGVDASAGGTEVEATDTPDEVANNQ